MITCIIVDDEQHAVDILEHYIQQTLQLQLVKSFTNPLEALAYLTTQQVDLIFLDIQMPELSGIDFIKTIHARSKVILTTAYSEFALEGYELYVVDYLLKPIRLARFLTAVQKVCEQLQTGKKNMEDNTDDFIFVKTESKGKLLKINLADIDYIESLKNYMAIHCGSQKTLVFTSLKELEERLPEKQFIRVHKSFIVPVYKITGIDGNIVKLKNVNADILIGESYKAKLMEMIQGKMVQ